MGGCSRGWLDFKPRKKKSKKLKLKSQMPAEPLILRLPRLLLCPPDTCAGKQDFRFLIAAIMNNFEILEIGCFPHLRVHFWTRLTPSLLVKTSCGSSSDSENVPITFFNQWSWRTYSTGPVNCAALYSEFDVMSPVSAHCGFTCEKCKIKRSKDGLVDAGDSRQRSSSIARGRSLSSAPLKCRRDI